MMRKVLLLTALVPASVTTAGLSHAAEIILQPDGTGDYPTIQEAIWASSEGDLISLAPGTYFESGIDLGGRAITIQPLQEAGSCHIAGNGNTIFVLDSGEDSTTVLKGLDMESWVGQGASIIRCIGATTTIEDCVFQTGMAPWQVGLYVVGSGPFLRRCTFRGNRVGAEFRGVTRNPIADCVFEGNTQGLVLFGGNGLRIEGCQFVGNETGLASPDQGLFDGDVSIAGCQFEGNRIGASFRTARSACSVDDCSFVRNLVSGASLAFETLDVASSEFVENGLEAFPSGTFGGLEIEAGTVIGCLFDSNRAKDAGGLRGRGLVRDCVFRDNIANGLGEEDGSGGALWGRISAEGCLFVSNRAGYGGAIYSTGSTILDCTFVDNVGYFSSAIELARQTTVAERIIIAGGQGGDAIRCSGDGASLDILCSDIWGNESGDWVGCLAGRLGQDGNITADPLFCDPDTGDYALASSSPCAEENNDCGTMGVYGEGCTPVPVRDTSWGGLKSRFYEPRR